MVEIDRCHLRKKECVFMSRNITHMYTGVRRVVIDLETLVNNGCSRRWEWVMVILIGCHKMSSLLLWNGRIGVTEVLLGDRSIVVLLTTQTNHPHLAVVKKSFTILSRGSHHPHRNTLISRGITEVNLPLDRPNKIDR